MQLRQCAADIDALDTIVLQADSARAHAVSTQANAGITVVETRQRLCQHFLALPRCEFSAASRAALVSSPCMVGFLGLGRLEPNLPKLLVACVQKLHSFSS